MTRYRVLEERLAARIGDVQRSVEHELRQTNLPGAHPHNHHDQLAEMERREMLGETKLSPEMWNAIGSKREDHAKAYAFVSESMASTPSGEIKSYTRDGLMGMMFTVIDRDNNTAWLCYYREQTWMNNIPVSSTPDGADDA